MTEHRAALRIRFRDAAAATAVAESLAADDDDFVSTRIDDETTVVMQFKADSIRSLRRAVDDALASLAVSEDVLDIG